MAISLFINITKRINKRAVETSRSMLVQNFFVTFRPASR